MFVIDVPYINLDQIYNSGQAPRWIKIKESMYVIPHKDKALKIQQVRDKYDYDKYRLLFSCTEEDFYTIWFKYFDIETDYLKLNHKVKKINSKFKKLANKGKGIHILNQNPFEMFIYCFIAEKQGFEKARKAINHIAEACGIEHTQSMRESGKVTWYEFPTPEMILINFDKLKKMGTINSWLKSLCEEIKDNITDLLNESETLLYKLLGEHDMYAFPITGIEETLRKNFGDNPEEFADWYLYDFNDRGLIYMYILHYIMNPPKEEIFRGFDR